MHLYIHIWVYWATPAFLLFSLMENMIRRDGVENCLTCTAGCFSAHIYITWAHCICLFVCLFLDWASFVFVFIFTIVFLHTFQRCYGSICTKLNTHIFRRCRRRRQFLLFATSYSKCAAVYLRFFVLFLVIFILLLLQWFI